MCKVLKQLKLKCGGAISIQASEFHYCAPRNEGSYSEWELGFPTDCPEEAVALLQEWDCGDGVYSYVPTATVAAFVKACGGADGMLLHPFALPSSCATREVSAYQRRVLGVF